MASEALTPKLSCLPVSLYPDFISGGIDVAEWAAVAANLGLDAIDLSVLITRKDKRNPGFPVDMVAAYTDFTHPDEAVREDEFLQFTKDLLDCVAIGADYFRVTAGQTHPRTSVEQGLNWAERYLRRAAEFAENQGIGLLFENHSKPGVWRYYDFAAEPENYFELIKRLEGANIDLLFDTANACFYNLNPVETLKRIFPRVKRIHVADIVKTGAFKPVLIGDGDVPIKEIFCFLKSNRFDGALSIEEASFTGLNGLEKAIRITRKLWNEAPLNNMGD